MKTKRTGVEDPAVDQSFETIGGAVEAASLGMDGLAHLGPLAVVLGLVALAATPVLWLRRRRVSS